MKRCTTIPYICTVREMIFTSISSTVLTSPESTPSDLMKKKMTMNEVHHDLENSSENATEKESSKKDKNKIIVIP